MRKSIFTGVRLIVASLLVTSAFTLIAWAQTTATLGSLGGVVTDPQGASVAGARRSGGNKETRGERKGSTSDHGTFFFSFFEARTSTVVFEASRVTKSLLS